MLGVCLMLCVPFVIGQDDTDAISLDITMNFNLNGGTNGPGSIAGWANSNSSYFDIYFTIPEKVPNKAGYTFVKWVLPSDVDFAGDSVGMDGFYPGTSYSVTVTVKVSEGCAAGRPPGVEVHIRSDNGRHDRLRLLCGVDRLWQRY